MDQLRISGWIRKYRCVLLVLLVGIVLMLLPEKQQTQQPPAPTEEAESMESRLEQILSRIDGAGEVAVMLTEASAEEIIYQTDGDDADTVLVTDADRNEQGLVPTREPPTYQGAIVVSTGADSASVRLALAEAVANVTGLGTDRITVLKMEQEA